MQEIILKQLKQIEHEHSIRICYAVESGSRAWGFASKNSDYPADLEWNQFIMMKWNVSNSKFNVSQTTGWKMASWTLLFCKS